MTKEATLLVAKVACLQKVAASGAIVQNCDTKLEEESAKLNEGGSPAVATESTNASNAATFDTQEHDKKMSSTGPANNVADNEDTTPRDKEASLADLLMKAAAEQPTAGKDEKLEEESQKEVVGGGNGNEVQSAQESAKAPALQLSSSQGGGDMNSNAVPRLDKAASFKAGQIFAVLKQNFA
jgi:hypothetical protein